jgi:processive 1,2-diacylglycerol beta-glucosyltransferase
MSAAPRVLILSAAIGEGHDLPARVLADELREEAPGIEVEIADGLEAMGGLLSQIIVRGSPFHSKWGNRFFDFEFWFISVFPPGRWIAGWFVYAFGARGLMRLIRGERPDVVVSTYPGVTDVLGRLRRRGKLAVPAVSAITDLAALRYWSHPGIDLHLLTHPESEEEVRQIAGDTDVVAVRGLNSPDFLLPLDPAEARRRLELAPEPKLVVVSGGGWAVGDLEGAVEAGLEAGAGLVVALCGRHEGVKSALEARFGDDERVQIWGFTDRMGELLAAADALVHSTAGLTVLEAHVRGCPTVSYGWGRAHIRANNRAFTRFGLAEVAPDRRSLGEALGRALAKRRDPDLSFAELPSAASVVLDRLGVRSRLGAGHEVADGA